MCAEPKTGGPGGGAPGSAPQALLPVSALLCCRDRGPALEPRLPEDLPAGGSGERARPVFWPVQPLRSVQPCAQPGLLKQEHGLRAILGRQVKTVREVVLPPQEGVEVIGDQQDLGRREGERRV